VPYFDGTAYIKNSTADWRSGDSQGAIGVIFKYTDISTVRTLFSSADEASTTRVLVFDINTSGQIRVNQRNNDTLDNVRGATAVNDGKFHLAFLTSTGTAWEIVLDGVAEGLTITGGANSGDWFADTANRDNFSIGARITSAISSYCLGQIGLVVVYSVAPSTTVQLQMYNRLKGVLH
jgi:hypothetical protein